MCRQRNNKEPGVLHGYAASRRRCCNATSLGRRSSGHPPPAVNLTTRARAIESHTVFGLEPDQPEHCRCHALHPQTENLARRKHGQLIFLHPPAMSFGNPHQSTPTVLPSHRPLVATVAAGHVSPRLLCSTFGTLEGSRSPFSQARYCREHWLRSALCSTF